MPLRPAQRPSDLERVARILGVGDEPAGAAGAAVKRLIVRASGDDDDVDRLDADLRRARRPGLLTAPDELRAGRRELSSSAVVALIALVVAVGCAFVLRVLWAERTSSASEVAPGPARSVQVDGETVSAATLPAPDRSGRSSAPTGGPSPPTGTVEVVVHVVGQVVRPGLVRLRQGARVADALTAAGGTTRGADLSALNLARLVIDGEQVRVPRPGESPMAGAQPPAGAPGGGSSPGAGGPGGAASGAPISLNAADAPALDTLPGVGPVLAQRIIDWRTQHGRFTSIDELGEVSGIGDKMMAQLRPRVTL